MAVRNAPKYALLWIADELAPVIIGIFAGVMLDKLFVCAAIGLIVTNLYRKFKDNQPDGYLMHLLYWFGIPITKAKSFKKTYSRRYTP
ncbi:MULTISPECIES: type IV conjugative transfer system protein TraL [Marinomonas]|uniref:Conjugal transfer pilus assembly protein TraL n=2 Tax=Marinomonas TaxID=28253 RepID=A0A368ZQL6_9GAMM|nr:MULTISPECIES: type IV conjugative transfer system protein TraL [Marinomonas]MBR7889860.1 type IV conjugative transfer system protein TraL [Marinomonas vulgaris]RCW98296.1 conjugal transfer pilus assembly protein TraL [Marinomonas foliarum]|tara:strand:+ start:6633 stop:6896 length:264 start_codon:yes stop_codon:yes gene_type:complete